MTYEIVIDSRISLHCYMHFGERLSKAQSVSSSRWTMYWSDVLQRCDHLYAGSCTPYMISVIVDVCLP
jgi:hypothetical protein